SGVPSGDLMPSRAASTCSLVIAPISRVATPPYGARGVGQRRHGLTSARRRRNHTAYRHQRDRAAGRQGGKNGEGGVSRSRRDGISHGRTPQEQGRPRGHG